MASERGNKPVVHTQKHIARLERERRQTRLILFSLAGIIIAVIALLVYGYLDIKYFQLDKPVAKVGDVEISTRDFQTRVKLERSRQINTYLQYYQFGQAFGMDVSTQLQQIQSQLDTPEYIGQSVLDAMINEELIRQEAAKRGITVSEAEIEKEIQRANGFFPDGTPSPTITPTEVTLPTLSPDILKYVTATSAATATPATTHTPTPAPASTGTSEPVETPTATLELTATPTEEPTPTAGPTFTPFPTATPYTLEGFKTAYQKGLDQFAKYGLSESGYRKLVETDLLRQKLHDIVTADTPHEEEQVWARHILVATEEDAQKVIERLHNGEDFGALARELSQDTASGAQGGDLGWFGKGAMVQPFEEAAFVLKVGEISAPVQSAFGWHVIQVIARQDRPLNATEYNDARDRAFQDFLIKLREEYKVEVYDSWKQNVPAEPNFNTYATESVQQATDQAATDQAAAPTETPAK